MLLFLTAFGASFFTSFSLVVLMNFVLIRKSKRCSERNNDIIVSLQISEVHLGTYQISMMECFTKLVYD